MTVRSDQGQGRSSVVLQLSIFGCSSVVEAFVRQWAARRSARRGSASASGRRCPHVASSPRRRCGARRRLHRPGRGSRRRDKRDERADRRWRSRVSGSSDPWRFSLLRRLRCPGSRCPDRTTGAPAAPPSTVPKRSTANDVGRLRRPAEGVERGAVRAWRAPRELGGPPPAGPGRRTQREAAPRGGGRVGAASGEPSIEGGGGETSVSGAIQLSVHRGRERPPGRGSARARGPGPGSWSSLSAELQRGEVEDDQRS